MPEAISYRVKTALEERLLKIRNRGIITQTSGNSFDSIVPSQGYWLDNNPTHLLQYTVTAGDEDEITLTNDNDPEDVVSISNGVETDFSDGAALTINWTGDGVDFIGAAFDWQFGLVREHNSDNVWKSFDCNILSAESIEKDQDSSLQYPHIVICPPEEIMNQDTFGIVAYDARRNIEIWSRPVTNDPELHMQRLKTAVIETLLSDTSLGGLIVDINITRAVYALNKLMPDDLGVIIEVLFQYRHEFLDSSTAH